MRIRQYRVVDHDAVWELHNLVLQLAHALESSGRFEEAQTTYQTLLKRTSSAEMGQIGRERLDVLEERMP